MMWALIINGVVAEISVLDPVGRFHPSLIWRACPEDVKRGWRFEKEEFLPPLDITKEKSRENKIAELRRELSKVDTATIRPIRAILSGVKAEEDEEQLISLEAEAKILRTNLQKLLKEQSPAS